MTRQASLHSQIESVLGPGGVRHDASSFAVDGVTPQAVAEPSTYEQAAEALRYASNEGLAVVPWGGGSHMHLGNTLRRYDIALSLRRLDGVVEHEPADLTVTCQAGTTLESLQRHLLPHGQTVPLGPLVDPRATIGGALAADAYGPRRYAYGTARDFTIGLRVATADGRLTRAGGRVVKNVAGYDLAKLYIGSLGTLGVIVEATFKLAPLPRAVRTVMVSTESVDQACALAAEIRRRGLAVRALSLLNAAAAQVALLSPDTPHSLLVELAGAPQAVERSFRDVQTLTAATKEQPDATVRRALAAVSPDAAGLLCKASSLPSHVPGVIRRLESVGEPRILALPTVGTVLASWPGSDDPGAILAPAKEAAARVGALFVVESCPPELKRQIDVFGEPPPAFSLMRSVKQQFDPEGILSPGRFVGRL